jgi:hypothetical protein
MKKRRSQLPPPAPSPPNASERKYLSRLEVARHLRCHPGTVDRYAREGYRDLVKLALFRERGRVWCRMTDLEAFRRECDHVDNPPPMIKTSAKRRRETQRILARHGLR